MHDISVKACSRFTYFTERSINHNSQHPNCKQKTQYFMYFFLLFYLRRIAPEIFDCIHGHLRLRQCVVYAPAQCSRIIFFSKPTKWTPDPVIKIFFSKPYNRYSFIFGHFFGVLTHSTSNCFSGAHFVGVS